MLLTKRKLEKIHLKYATFTHRAGPLCTHPVSVSLPSKSISRLLQKFAFVSEPTDVRHGQKPSSANQKLFSVFKGSVHSWCWHWYGKDLFATRKQNTFATDCGCINSVLGIIRHRLNNFCLYLLWPGVLSQACFVLGRLPYTTDIRQIAVPGWTRKAGAQPSVVRLSWQATDVSLSHMK